MENQKFNPVVWFEIYVADMDRASKFYETVLNIQLKDMTDPSNLSLQMRFFPGELSNGGASGSLVKMADSQVGGANVIIYFGCEDCAVEEARVVPSGGKVCQPKMAIGEFGFMSIVTDTEGNTIGLHSMK